MFTKEELIKLKEDLLIGRICFECIVNPSEDRCKNCTSNVWGMIKRINEELDKL